MKFYKEIDVCNSEILTDNLNKNKFDLQKMKSNHINLYLTIDDISNLDYLSNTFDFQITTLEIYKDIQNISNKYLEDNEISLIKETNYESLEKLYPNLILNELDYQNFNEFKQFYYIKNKNLLIKKIKLNLQNRCMIDMQNYPFINSPCKLNFHSLSLNNKFNSNYTICNLDNFINKKFSFSKFNINIISLSILDQCNYLNIIESNLKSNLKCFQLLIQFESSKRFFYINFLIAFNLLLISYISLYIPIYNHTFRCLMLTLPILGIYLFDQTLFKNDKFMKLQSTSLHIWRLACLLYIGFNFFCYILAFYSLEKVKNLVEKSDIEYLGYMLKSAKLIKDENVIDEMNKKQNNEIINYDLKKISSINLIKPNLSKISFNLKKKLDRTNSKLNLLSRIRKFKTSSLEHIKSNKSIENLKLLKINKSLTSVKPLELNKSLTSIKQLELNKSLTSIKPSLINKSLTSIKSIPEQLKTINEVELKKSIVDTSLDKEEIYTKSDKNEIHSKSDRREIDLKSDKNLTENELNELKDTITMNLKKDLDNIKKDLINDDKKLSREKAKSLRILNDILNFKHKKKSKFKHKKIVSRFISSSKLKTIEFISLIPSDRYARIMVPSSFFIFIYFYALHFIM